MNCSGNPQYGWNMGPEMAVYTCETALNCRGRACRQPPQAPPSSGTTPNFNGKSGNPPPHVVDTPQPDTHRPTTPVFDGKSSQ